MYKQSVSERLLFPRKKNIRFFGIFLWKISHCKLDFAFLLSNENKNGDISDEKSQKRKRKKGFSTTLKNNETNFWLVSLFFVCYSRLPGKQTQKIYDA